MIEERIAALHESGAVLMEKFGGSFAECVRQSNHSSQALLQLITENFPLFRDWLEYKGRTVYFLKRAQLLIGEIWRLYDGAGLGHFHDIHALTMFADYRVPQILEFMGALKYSDSFRTALLEKRVFPRDNPQEIEMRGCCVQAVELIKPEIVKRLEAQQLADSSVVLDPQEINSVLIDFFLWTYASTHRTELASSPIIRIRTTNY
eukprot:m.267313 g.267313  ORF g.267313 m.267313 type:complete len:205 (-) comp54715_c0_seq9:148-762(-)